MGKINLANLEELLRINCDILFGIRILHFRNIIFELVFQPLGVDIFILLLGGIIVHHIGLSNIYSIFLFSVLLSLLRNMVITAIRFEPIINQTLKLLTVTLLRIRIVLIFKIAYLVLGQPDLDYIVLHVGLKVLALEIEERLILLELEHIDHEDHHSEAAEADHRVRQFESTLQTLLGETAGVLDEEVHVLKLIGSARVGRLDQFAFIYHAFSRLVQASFSDFVQYFLPILLIATGFVLR